MHLRQSSPAREKKVAPNVQALDQREKVKVQSSMDLREEKMRTREVRTRTQVRNILSSKDNFKKDSMKQLTMLIQKSEQSVDNGKQVQYLQEPMSGTQVIKTGGSTL